MKSKAAIFSRAALLLALQLGASHETYQPATDHYRIISWREESKDHWAARCSEGNFHEWSLVILNSAFEVNITNNLGLDADAFSCFVGGSTHFEDVQQHFRYHGSDTYIPNDTGTYDIVAQFFGDSYVGKGAFLRPEPATKRCAVCENGAQAIHERLTFASTTREYKLLESSTQHNYAYMASRCTDLGDGWAPGGHRWAPAVLNDQTEVDFIRQGQRGYSDIKSYWIGGSTTSQPWSLIALSQYSTGSSGPNRVIISTWGRNPDGYNANRFQMKTIVPLQGIFGILCEKDLGAGWGPTVLDDQAELDFIKQAQKGLSHFRSYWIGGSTTADAGHQIQFSEYSATEGENNVNNVMVETGNRDGYDLDNFRLVAGGATTVVADSMLCEKGKNFSAQLSSYLKQRYWDKQ